VIGPVYLAWRYMAHHRVKTGILVGAIALIVFLPAGLYVLIGESASALTARADATPLLVGARGSTLELVLNSLYFGSEVREPTRFSETERVAASGLADPIPLYVRFHAAGQPIVGTALEYFDFRGLHFAKGRPFAVLGECVVGAKAARLLGVGPGDFVLSSPESVFDLAGVYPLKMRVSGVLAANHGPDDEAVFVDVKTAWVVAGLGHGHQDLATPAADSAVLSRDGARITANASVVEYNEIVSENADTFHFHGDPANLPLTGILAVPRDDKARVLLMGRYEEPGLAVQIVRPRLVVDELLETVVTIRSYVVAALAIVSAATLVVAGLVFGLSLRLRQREIETIVKIGGSRTAVAGLLASEVVAVLALGAGLAGLLTVLLARFGGEAIRALLLS
jgi:putative ABC transport system permease protein